MPKSFSYGALLRWICRSSRLIRRVRRIRLRRLQRYPTLILAAFALRIVVCVCRSFSYPRIGAPPNCGKGASVANWQESGGECRRWRMANNNQMDTFSSGVSRDETIKPVWREKVRTAMCWGRGCSNWAALEHRGGRMAATPPTSRARLLLSQWHRRQSSSCLIATMRSYPTTIREPHLPASPQPLRGREVDCQPIPLPMFPE